MHVFISWSGENSQVIASALSKTLAAIFENGKNPFTTFMSSANIMSKKMIVFVRDKSALPYMLQEADIAIDNFHMFQYKEIGDIIHQIASNGTSFLF